MNRGSTTIRLRTNLRMDLGTTTENGPEPAEKLPSRQKDEPGLRTSDYLNL